MYIHNNWYPLYVSGNPLRWRYVFVTRHTTLQVTWEAELSIRAERRYDLHGDTRKMHFMREERRQYLCIESIIRI